MADHDNAPLSSYSDPFYDRLDALFQQLRRIWWLVVLGIILVAGIAVWLRMQVQADPNAITAALVVEASNAEPDQAEGKWKAIADDSAAPAVYRARAAIELTHLLLAKGDTVQAKDRALLAEAQARAAADDDMLLTATISRGAVALQANDAGAAFGFYDQAAKAAGARHPVRKLDADLGAARALAAQGKLDEAVARLEPLTTRKERGAEQLLSLAQTLYWTYKREAAIKAQPAPAPQAEAPAAPSETPAVAPPAAPQPEAPAATQPGQKPE
jgi:hypothetical protein